MYNGNSNDMCVWNNERNDVKRNDNESENIEVNTVRTIEIRKWRKRNEYNEPKSVMDNDNNEK